MLEIMFMIFIFTGKSFIYEAECFSHHVENTFLCMRQNPRGPTLSMTEMNDRFKDEKSDTHAHTVPVAKKLFTLFGKSPISIGLGM